MVFRAAEETQEYFSLSDKKWANIATIVFGAIGGALAFKYFGDAGPAKEWGLYVMFAGALAMIIGTVMHMKKAGAASSDDA
jgi:hypothetical protein